MRHAKSDWSGPIGDYERPITQKGVDRTKAIVEALQNDRVKLTHAWVSPYLRAKMTLEVVLEEFQEIHEEEVDEIVSSGMPRLIKQKILAFHNEFPESSLIIIGHDPSMSSLASELSDKSIYMRTSEVCALNFDGQKFSFIKYYSRNSPDT